jgi:hypothetical protein
MAVSDPIREIRVPREPTVSLVGWQVLAVNFLDRFLEDEGSLLTDGHGSRRSTP